MKRLTLHIAAVTMLLGLHIATAQELPSAAENNATTADPIADLTARIMQKFSLAGPTGTLNANPFLPNSATSQALAGTSREMIPKSLRERFSMAAQQMDSNPFADQTIKEIEQHMQQMSSRFSQLAEMKLPQPNFARQAAAFANSNQAMARSSAWTTTATPPLPALNAAAAQTGKSQAIAMSVANGIYSIEASVETETGPQTVRLNGTKSEVKEQIDQLKPGIREALGVSLGL